MKPFLLLIGLTLLSVPTYAEDCPQWQGPGRNAISNEAGLLREWPEGGPKVPWKVTAIGTGYSAPAVANGRLYGMSKRGEDCEEEVIGSRSEQDGAEVWGTKIANATEGGMRQGIEGTDFTPTVDGGSLYALGHGGDLKTEGGAIVWLRRKSFASGVVEVLNRKVNIVTRKAYGFRSEEKSTELRYLTRSATRYPQILLKSLKNWKDFKKLLLSALDARARV